MPKSALLCRVHLAGSSGVLVVRKSIMTNDVPVIPGGGTVGMVTSSKVVYEHGVEAREEGGTPNICENHSQRENHFQRATARVELSRSPATCPRVADPLTDPTSSVSTCCAVADIRAGLAFVIKTAIGARYIEQLEHRLVKKVLAVSWSTKWPISHIERHGLRAAPLAAPLSLKVVSLEHPSVRMQRWGKHSNIRLTPVSGCSAGESTPTSRSWGLTARATLRTGPPFSASWSSTRAGTGRASS